MRFLDWLFGKTSQPQPTRTSSPAAQAVYVAPQSSVTGAGEEGDFLLSMAIGAATDNAVLGGLLGGDFCGGIIGDAMDGDLFD